MNNRPRKFVSDNFNMEHLIRFCKVYNAIVQYYNFEHCSIELINKQGIAILNLLPENTTIDEIIDELVTLHHLYFTLIKSDFIPSGFTLHEMKTINRIYKSLIKHGIIPSSKRKIIYNDQLDVRNFENVNLHSFYDLLIYENAKQFNMKMKPIIKVKRK